MALFSVEARPKPGSQECRVLHKEVVRTRSGTRTNKDGQGSSQKTIRNKEMISPSQDKRVHSKVLEWRAANQLVCCHAVCPFEKTVEKRARCPKFVTQICSAGKQTAKTHFCATSLTSFFTHMWRSVVVGESVSAQLRSHQALQNKRWITTHQINSKRTVSEFRASARA